jgi:general secretion pathway protein A
MYTSYFGLSEKPFAITPDPRYLFMSERHAEALAHLLYGITDAGGFIQLTGEVGTGKTTVVRSLLERMPRHADVAVMLNPQLTPTQFVLSICEELGIFVADQDADSIKSLIDLLNHRLLEAHGRGRRVVVIVDEAQNLSTETLEQVRLLTNLETASQKLLQVILIGQPELRDVLARVDLRQLAQRITGRYHLNPLSRAETAAYVNHRMRVAGSSAQVFTPGALREVHRLSKGVPRIINVISDRALLGAFTQDSPEIDPPLVRGAAGEVYGRTVHPLWLKVLAGASATVTVAGMAIGLWQLFKGDPASAVPQPPIAASVAASPMAAGALPTRAVPLAAPGGAQTPRAASSAGATRDVGELLKTYAGETTTENAFRSLFALWGGEFNPRGGRPCEQALQQGLQCSYQPGTWAQLRTLNRPAILTLFDESGNEHQVTMVSVDSGLAVVNLNNQRHTVSIASITKLWYGDYLVLWRPQVASQRTLSQGMQGASVRWLRRSLLTLQGRPNTSVSDFYDPELVKLVEDFQRKYRLKVDGVAGVQTQIIVDMLNNPAGAPLLAKASSG